MGGAGLAVVAKRLLTATEMIREPFIILVREKGSQGKEREESGSGQDLLHHAS
jgi:hypothetical protein